ncbi:MAG: hypothetical protein NVS1B4_26810 [Gemmatimonadaceae bacterium]
MRALALTALMVGLLLATGLERKSHHHAATRPIVDRAHSRQSDSVVRAILVSDARFPLDSDVTLGDVQRVLGKAPLRDPKHHDDVSSVCYVGRDALGSFTLLFQSDQMGGPEHRLLGAEFSRGGVARHEQICSALAAHRQEVRTDNGLRLGMPVSEVLRIMGRPTRHERSRYHFDHDAHRSTPDHDIMSTVEAETNAGRVTRLRVWYVSVY